MNRKLWIKGDRLTNSKGDCAYVYAVEGESVVLAQVDEHDQIVSVLAGRQQRLKEDGWVRQVVVLPLPAPPLNSCPIESPQPSATEPFQELPL